MIRRSLVLPPLALLALLSACAGTGDEPAAGADAAAAAEVPQFAEREAYFGNLHVHTRYSFDGFTNGSVTTPDDAYRWAQGGTIKGSRNGEDFTIKRPLDWYAVSDHGEFMGVFPLMEDSTNPLSRLDIAKRVTADDEATRFAAFAEILNQMSAKTLDPRLTDPSLGRSVWAEIIATADKHYKPGRFTTFAAYEWTSNPGQQNLHRVVLFKGTTGLPELVYSSFDSDREEDLWRWMDGIRDGGTPLLAVPHNGNASNGLMFAVDRTYGGSALDSAYAATRMRNEQVYEITQIKGTSEVHPSINRGDEFAGFELWDYTLSADAKPPAHKVGGYMREALNRGLLLEEQGTGNPFKYGFIGDSDTHNSASSPEEDNNTGKFALEANPEHRLMGAPGMQEKNNRQVREFSSGGLAGVWATSNTREAIFDAIHRKETFATSGPRLRVRLFGGFGYAAGLMDQADWLAQAYAGGVPMGGDLRRPASGGAPTLLILATKEPDGANLDRIQVIKGWVEGGRVRERTYDVALADGRTADAAGKVPPVGNTVKAEDASYSNDIGDPELRAAWTDPDFDPGERAYYYVRVLQIPTPRWSTYDAVRLGVPPRTDLPVSIQERAWSSPIWYTP